MRNRRRLIVIGLLAGGAIAVSIAALVVTSGGRPVSPGDARACGAFYAWYDQKGSPAPVLTAYQEATSEPLASDLLEVSHGLQALAREAGHDTTPGQALTEISSLKAEQDCNRVGVANPLG